MSSRHDLKQCEGFAVHTLSLGLASSFQIRERRPAHRSSLPYPILCSRRQHSPLAFAARGAESPPRRQRREEYCSPPRREKKARVLMPTTKLGEVRRSPPPAIGPKYKHGVCHESADSFAPKVVRHQYFQFHGKEFAAWSNRSSPCPAS